MKICIVKGCTNIISDNKNNKGDKINFCKKHIKHGIKTQCEICKKVIYIKVRDYKKNYSKKFFCRTCKNNTIIIKEPEDFINAIDVEEHKNNIIDLALDSNNFENLNKVIIFDNIKELMDKSGIWYLESSNGKILDVYKSNNIGKDIIFVDKALKKGKSNIEKSDDELKTKHGKNYSIYKKYRDIAKYENNNNENENNIIFKLAIQDETDQELLKKIEIKFAKDNKALFWDI